MGCWMDEVGKCGWWERRASTHCMVPVRSLSKMSQDETNPGIIGHLANPPFNPRNACLLSAESLEPAEA